MRLLRYGNLSQNCLRLPEQLAHPDSNQYTASWRSFLYITKVSGHFIALSGIRVQRSCFEPGFLTPVHYLFPIHAYPPPVPTGRRLLHANHEHEHVPPLPLRFSPALLRDAPPLPAAHIRHLRSLLLLCPFLHLPTPRPSLALLLLAPVAR